MIIKWYRKLFVECTPLQGYVAHIPHGVINVFMATHVCWVIAVLFGVGYMFFQDGHERNNLDPAHYDLAGWLLGLVIGSAGYILLDWWYLL